MISQRNHSSTHYGYAFSSLTLSLLVILTNIFFSSVSVHYDAEIECTVIDMMQLKNLHGKKEFIIVPRISLL